MLWPGPDTIHKLIDKTTKLIDKRSDVNNSKKKIPSGAGVVLGPTDT